MGDKIYTLRMDELLFDKVKTSADKNKRSIAKEIEYIIELYYENNFYNENYSEIKQLLHECKEMLNKSV